jgi:hypothetical protein
LGGETEKWYPADKLWIVDWQPVHRKLDDEDGEGMVDLATRSPAQNSELILKEASPLLGIGQTIHKISASGRKIPLFSVSF